MCIVLMGNSSSAPSDPPGVKIKNEQDTNDIVAAFQAKDLTALKRIRDGGGLNTYNQNLVNQAISALEAGYGPDKLPPGAPQPVAPGNTDDMVVNEQIKTIFRGASSGPNTKRQAAIDQLNLMISRTNYPLSEKNKGAAQYYIDELKKQIEAENVKNAPAPPGPGSTPEPPKPVTPGANDDKMVEEQIKTIYRGASTGPNDKRQSAITALDEMIQRTTYPLSEANKSLAQTYIDDLRKQITEATNKEHYEKIRAMYNAKNKEGLIAFRSTPNLSPANKNYLEACISALTSGDTIPEDVKKDAAAGGIVVPGPAGSPAGASSGLRPDGSEIMAGVGGGSDRKRKFGAGVPSIDKFISEETWQAARGMVDNLKRYSGIDVTPELTAKILYNYAKRQAPGSVVGKASEFVGMLPFDYGLSSGEKQTLQKAVQYLDQGRALGQDVTNFDLPKLLSRVSPEILRNVDAYKDQTQKRRRGLRYKPFEIIEKSLQDYASSNADSIISRGLATAQQTGVADFLRNVAYDKMDSIVGNRR